MTTNHQAGTRSGPVSARPKRIDDLGSRDALIEGLSAPPDEHFFRILTRSLAVTLDVRFGFVSEVAEEPGSFKLLAFWNGEAFGENFTYSAKGTPCERVLGKRSVSIRKGVQKAYPEDVWLAEIGAESYMAVPLLSSDGSALGHLGVLDGAPMDTSRENVAVLQVFATRAAGELQRDAQGTGSQLAIDALETIVEGAPGGILRVDQDGKILFANPRVETMFGYEHDELLGRRVEQLMPSRLRHQHREHRKRFTREPHDRPMGENLDLMAQRKDGSAFPVAIWLSAAGGGATAFITDETKIKQSMERLERSRERLEAMLRALPELAFVLDGNGVYLDFVSAEGITPYIPPEQFLGKCMRDVLPAEVAEPAMARIKLAIETNEIQRLKYTLNRPNGKRWYEGCFVRLDDDRVALFVRDLTVEQLRMTGGNRREARSGLADEIEGRMQWRNPYGLSYREFSVLQMLKGGTTDKEIANDLGISVFTVNKHVSNILTKMNAASRTEATIRALQEGLIT